MRKLKKIAALLAAGSCLTSTLTGCSKVADEIITSLVQCNLDSVYLNQHNETYLKMVDLTAEEAKNNYDEGIQLDAENFAYYWGITDDVHVTYADLDTELQNDIFNLCSTISQKAKYVVQSAAAQDDGSYAVKVVVEPIDIIEQANTMYNEDTYEPLSTFWSKYEESDYTDMTTEDYIAISNEYGTLMVQMVEELLPNLGYMEEKSLNIQLEEVNDLWEINEDDLETFYEYVVSYPY